ncbi:MAG TPA: ABC transporter substrate-binding protein [Myxococcota bacterium]|nr:ABC transporter substrate-binding protein [Myxococcota bacterium]
MTGRRLRLALGLALFALSCAKPTVIRNGTELPYEQAADADLAQAKAYLQKNQPAKAEEVLQRFETELGKSRRADEALWLLGEAQAARGKKEQAASTWRRLVEDYPKSDQNVPAALRAAQLYQSLERPADGRAVIARANQDRTDAETRAKLNRLDADLARSLGDWPEVVRALAFARRDTRDPQQLTEIDVEISDLLEVRMREPELVALIEKLPRGPVYDRVGLEIARRALARGDVAAAREALDRLPRRLSEGDEAERAVLLARAADLAGEASATLGLVLPLSGPYQKLGESFLRGITLGSGIYDEKPSQLHLLVRDSAGEAARAAAAVTDLTGQHVAAIIGPVRSAEAVEAVPPAEAAKTPLLSFARRDDIADLGEYVFRLGLTPGDQAATLVRWCAEERGCKKYAILYPSDEYGTAFKNQFTDAVEKSGGQVTGSESYKPGSVDWQPEIKHLVGLANLPRATQALVDERNKLRRHAQENAEKLASPRFQGLPPFVDFDAVFIPDDAQSVGLILPQLRFFDVRDVVYLGGSGWNDPALIKIAGREATRAVFTDEFWSGSSRPEVVEFVRRYAAAYGGPPDEYAAEGYDAAALLRFVLAGGDAPSGEVLRDRLLRVSGFPGVSGLQSFDQTGGARKSLEFLTVRDNAIVATTPPAAPQ